jgi:hypothetical protein
MLLVCCRSSAQAFDSSLAIPKSLLKNTSFTAYFLTDSFSKAGDTVQSGANLLRVDPYYLLRLGYTTANLEHFFVACKVTASAKEEFRKKFITVYNTPRTENYKKLKEMLDEDMEARAKLGKCSDSASCAVLEQKINLSDSVHFAWLWSCVQKGGWPPLSDGSLYAEVLALHDGDHIRQYIPLMKKAVLSSQASYDGYLKLCKQSAKVNFEQLLKRYKNKSMFDISYIQRPDTPTNAQVELIKKTVREHKPIKHIYFVFESNSEKDYDRFMKSPDGYVKDQGYWNAWDLLVDVEHYQRDLLHSADYIPYQFTFSESPIKRKKLTLYLFY